MSVTDTEPLVVHELFFSSEGGEEGEITLSDDEKKKVIWKDILREGTFAMTPAGGGIRRRPFKVIPDGESDASSRVISMSDIEDAFKSNAFEHVTIPTRHADELLDNTGLVRGLRRVTRKGKIHLQAALGFTEPDIAGKVRRGTIPNVSSGVFFDFIRKADAKKFRCALKHVALTHSPFINNLEPFKAVFASDDEIEGEPTIQAYQFDTAGDNVDAGGTTDSTASKGEIVWNEADGTNWIRENVQTALNPQDQQQQVDDGRPFVPKPYYWVKDISVSDKALVEESYKGDRKTFVIPFERKAEGVEIAPSTRWIESREAMIAASDDNFTEMAFDAVRDRLGTALSEMAGDKFALGDIALDGRVRIHSDDKSWVAGFATFSGGAVMLDDPANWTRTSHQEDAPKPKPEEKKETQRQAPSPTSSIAMSDTSTTVGSGVKAAREQRRQLIGAARKSR